MSNYNFGNFKNIPYVIRSLYNATQDPEAMARFSDRYPQTASRWYIESALPPGGGFVLNPNHLYAFIVNSTNPDGKNYSIDDIIQVSAHEQSRYSTTPLEYVNIISGLNNIVEFIKLDLERFRGGKKSSRTLKKTKSKAKSKAKSKGRTKSKRRTTKYKGKKTINRHIRK
jgi:hypothetical protein